MAKAAMPHAQAADIACNTTADASSACSDWTTYRSNGAASAAPAAAAAPTASQVQHLPCWLTAARRRMQCCAAWARRCS